MVSTSRTRSRDSLGVLAEREVGVIKARQRSEARSPALAVLDDQLVVAAEQLLHVLQRDAPSAVRDGIAVGILVVAEVRDVLKPDLELAALVRLDPSKLQIVSNAEVNSRRQLRRPARLTIDGESARS